MLVNRRSQNTHVVKYNDRFRLIRGVFRAKNCSCLKVFVIVNLWVNYTSLLSSTFFAKFFKFVRYSVWSRITEVCAILKMHLLSILLINSHFRMVLLFFYSNDYVMSLFVTPEVPEGICSTGLRST